MVGVRVCIYIYTYVEGEVVGWAESKKRGEKVVKDSYSGVPVVI